MGEREESMVPRLSRRSFRGALGALLALFCLLLIAGLTAQAERKVRSGPESAIDAAEEQFARGLGGHQGFERPAGRSPLGDFEPVWDAAAGAGAIETPLGRIDPGRLEELRARVPQIASERGRALGHGRK